MKTVLEIEPAYESSLCAAGLADFDAMMRAAGGPPASRHAHRETLPIDIEVDGEPKPFFLKRVFKVPPKHAFWPMFRGTWGRSQPYHEWHRLAELEKAGIPAMRRAAFGERRRFGMPAAAFILVEAAPMAHTLENWLVPGFPVPPMTQTNRSRLFCELGILLGRLHRGGFSWPDLHPKHIFAAPAVHRRPHSVWRFCLIDVERMVKPRRRSRNIAQGDLPADVMAELRKFADSLRPAPLAEQDVKAFWAGYLEPVTGPVAAPAWEAEAPDRLPRLPDDYEHPRRVPLRRRGGMFVDERVVPWLRAGGLDGFDDVFAFTNGEHLSKPGLGSHRDRVRMRITNGDGARKTFYIKLYRRPPLLEQLRRMREWRPASGSGRRESHYAERLSLLGIPTLRTVAFGEEMKGWLERRSFGITEEIRGRSLEVITREVVEDPAKTPAWADRKEMIRLLAVITRRLHEHGLYHRDLYLCHVFLTRNADGGVVLHLIDLARMIARRRRGERWKIKDLAALDYSAPAPPVTRADRLRFLYHYMACGDDAGGRAAKRGCTGRRCVRDILRRIGRRTQRMARHDVRSRA